MQPIGQIAHRFPLIARPRPACIDLAGRVRELVTLAERADQDNDTAAASAVQNKAALIASDCGLPELAREWCHQHAAAYLHALPLGAQHARQALEPLVNLARLHIRDRDGNTGYRLLDDLYTAVADTRDTTIDGQPVPASQLTATAADHTQLRQWLWSVHIADGARALTSAGRWHDAHEHLQHHHGIGRRMLDGRQVSVLDHLTAGNHRSAHAVIADTAAGLPWENAVTATLAALTRHEAPGADHVNSMLTCHQQLSPTDEPTVFYTRLTLTVIDAADSESPPLHAVENQLVDQVVKSHDGYAARDLLAHDRSVLHMTPHDVGQLKEIVHTAGLDQQHIPNPIRTDLDAALTTSHAVLARLLPPRRRTAFPVDWVSLESSAYEGEEESMPGESSTDPRRGRDACHSRIAAGRQAGERPNMRSADGAWPRDT